MFSKKINTSPWLRRFVGLAIGTLLGSVFFDLLPETIELFEDAHRASFIILGSILAFFIIERTIHYHHCLWGQKKPEENRTHLIVNNLIGDGFHNFVDGTIIAGAFLINPGLGIGTTIAIAFHEIPQEVADYSILVYSGLSRFKALSYNLLFGLTSVLGAVLVFLFHDSVENLVPILMAIAVGNFIYLSMADLVPELSHEKDAKQIRNQFFWVALGLGILFLVSYFGGHGH